MHAHRLNSNSWDLARNLRENQLGGVIFGCKHDTIEECLRKQLSGLPSVHYSYVRNIKPGLPLFLFNYSERRLHGLFEAASPGQMSIDLYAWSKDGSLSTTFPAQISEVHICMKTQYLLLLETQFRKVLVDNYYNHHHFYFELDHAQARDLISLLKSLAPANFNQVPAVSSKKSHIASLPSTERKTSAVPDPQRVEANSKGTTNPFNLLPNASGVVPTNWGYSDADNTSVSSHSDTGRKEFESGEPVSDWDDSDDNVF